MCGNHVKGHGKKPFPLKFVVDSFQLYLTRLIWGRWCWFRGLLNHFNRFSAFLAYIACGYPSQEGPLCVHHSLTKVRQSWLVTFYAFLSSKESKLLSSRPQLISHTQTQMQFPFQVRCVNLERASIVKWSKSFKIKHMPLHCNYKSKASYIDKLLKTSVCFKPT